MAGTFQIRLDREQGCAVLTCVAVAPSLRGSGLARPLVSSAISLAFGEAGIERLELRVFTFNAPAIRTYRGLGFVEEGVLRAAVRVGEARWDLMVMSLLRGDLPG